MKILYTICAIGFRFELSMCYVQVHEKRKKHQFREGDVKKERRRRRKKKKKREREKKGHWWSGSDLIETTQENGSHQIGFFNIMPLKLSFQLLKTPNWCFQFLSLSLKIFEFE